MKVIIDATEVVDQLAKCKVGDEKAITFTVTKNHGQTIEGTASLVEHVTGEEEYEEESATTPEMAHGRAGKKVPKAIMIIAEKA